MIIKLTGADTDKPLFINSNLIVSFLNVSIDKDNIPDWHEIKRDHTIIHTVNDSIFYVLEPAEFIKEMANARQN